MLRALRRLELVAERANAWLNDHTWLVAIAIVLILGGGSVAMAGAKPLWHDEIYTVLLAGLPTSQLWSANLSGVDLSPPLNTLLTRGAMKIAGEGPIATRLPPLAGFLLAVVVVFGFVRRRANTVTAAIAALLLAFTAAYRYSYEARGYGLMMGFAALSLYAWSEAAAGRRRLLNAALLSCSLAAGYWTHFYGVFAVVPVFAGEGARFWRTRKIDKAIVAAVALSMLAVLPLLPLIRAGSSLAPSFWGRAGLREVFPAYSFLLNSLVELPFIFGTVALLVAAFLARRRLAAAVPSHLPYYEIAAVAAAVAIPAVQIIVAMTSTGVFVSRYAMLALPGICIALALTLFRLVPSAAIHLAAAVALTAGFAQAATYRPAFTNPARARPALMRLLTGDRPVLITGGLVYLQLWYYTPPAMRGKLQYIVHPGAARHFTGSDTIDRGLIGLAKWTPLPIVEPRPFVTAHREFIVYWAGAGWLVQWLQEGKADMDKIEVEANTAILAVRHNF